MKLPILSASVLALSSLTACGDKPPTKGGEPLPKTKTSSSASAATSASAAPWAAVEQHFPGWDMEARKKAWQGAWVLEGFSIGMWDAWEVKGLSVKVWDGKSEREEELSLSSPCTAGISGPNGGYVSHYTVEGDKLMTGLGDAGSRRGSVAIACVSNVIFTIGADGKCSEWDTFMNFFSKPGTCSIGKEGEQELFIAELRGSTTKVPVHGDAIYSDQIKSTHAERMPDFAAAKAERDKRTQKP